MFDRAVFQILVMLCFPLFSYAGVIGTASGMVDLKDMKPLLNRLRPSSRKMMVSNQYYPGSQLAPLLLRAYSTL